MHHSTKLLFFSFLLFSMQLNAGKLSDFEKDIKNSKNTPHTKRYQSCKQCAQEDDSFFDIIFEGILDNIVDITAVIIEDGSTTSSERIKKHPLKSGISPRKTGEILIPFYRFNINYQHVNDKINAFDLKMEFGKGVNGVELRTTQYDDSLANEELKYHQLQYFHRMSFGNQVAVNLGLGYARIDITDSFDGLILSLPMLYQNNNHLGIEVRPSYFNADGVDISELDFSVMYTYRKTAFRLGHRSIQSTNIDIKGVYLGLDFIF